MNQCFKNREEAGQILAEMVLTYRQASCTMVIGIPRGGVIVAHEIAKVLGVPLDVICPRKIGCPKNPELALGALIEDLIWFDERIVRIARPTDLYLEKTMGDERLEAARREVLYRQNRPPMEIQNQTIILVDDGIATGATMHVSVDWLRKKGARKIVVAAPVGFEETVETLKLKADQVICLEKPRGFMGVGQFYESFRQTEDGEVVSILQKMNLQNF